MFNNSTDRINKIVGKLEATISELQEAEEASILDIEKDDIKLLKIRKGQEIKKEAMIKASRLRNNLSKLFEE